MFTSAPVGKIIPVEGEPFAMKWELERRKLRGVQKCVSPTFTLDCYLLGKYVPLSVSCYCKLSEDGRLGYFASFPAGTKARWVQWVGPERVKTRYATDRWSEGFIGKSAYWNPQDHINQRNCLVFGIAVLLCEPPAGMVPTADYFTLGDKLGSGSFGSVFEVTGNSDLKIENLVAKVQKNMWWDSLGEASVLAKFSGLAGFPQFTGLYKSEPDVALLVMQRLHRTVESLQRDSGVFRPGALSPHTIIEVGMQCIRRLRDMHERGFLHRDMKPENIMVDSLEGDTLHFIDFGLSRYYRVGGVFIELPPSICGTVRYCAVAVHEGKHTPFCDIEGMVYVIMYLVAGSLPWQNCKADTKTERNDLIHRIKSDTKQLAGHLTEKLPTEPLLVGALMELVRYCREEGALGITPNYDLLLSQLSSARSLQACPLMRIVSQKEADLSETPNAPLDWLLPDGCLSPAAKAMLRPTVTPFGTIQASKGRLSGTGTRELAGALEDVNDIPFEEVSSPHVSEAIEI